MKTTFKFAVGALALAATSAFAGLPLTLTSYVANATLSLSTVAQTNAAAAGVTLRGLGNTITQPNGVYVFPATKSDITLATVAGALPVKVNSGAASGSALRLHATTDGDVVLANFNVDFNKHIVYSDIIDVYEKTTAKAVPLYTFVDVMTSKATLKGLSLNVHAEINKLTFTPEAVTRLQAGLLLDDILVAALKTIDWGGIVVDVTSKTRAKKTNDAAFTLKQVPAWN